MRVTEAMHIVRNREEKDAVDAKKPNNAYSWQQGSDVLLTGRRRALLNKQTNPPTIVCSEGRFYHNNSDIAIVSATVIDCTHALDNHKRLIS